MGNHDIPCSVCGEDTRGLAGVRGCSTVSEALKTRCSHYTEFARRPKFILPMPEEPPTFEEAMAQARERERQPIIEQLRHLAHPLAEVLPDSARLAAMIQLVNRLPT